MILKSLKLVRHILLRRYIKIVFIHEIASGELLECKTSYMHQDKVFDICLKLQPKVEFNILKDFQNDMRTFLYKKV